MKKKKEQELTALWINEIGNIKTRRFKVLKVEGNKVTALFDDNKKYIFDKSKIRGQNVVVIEDANGKVKLVDPESWKKIDYNAEGIKEFRFNLQNFRQQESVSAISRWTLPKSTLDKILPLLKFLLIGAAVAVVGWAAFKYAGYIFNNILGAFRFDCISLVPNKQVPIDVVRNITA